MGRYSSYLKKLKVCKKEDLLEIGQINGLPMYKIVLNPAGTTTVVFSAAIHGDEISGPWAIVDFLKNYKVKKFPKLKIIIFPVANPTGFNRGTRNNFQGKDLNRLFCRKKLTRENRIVIQTLNGERIFLFHALHGDIDERSFYLYNFEHKPEKIYRGLVIAAKKYVPINTSPKIYDDPAAGGLITNQHDSSFEDHMFRDGTPYSFCTEAPEKLPLKKTIALNVALMDRILKFAYSK